MKLQLFTTWQIKICILITDHLIITNACMFTSNKIRSRNIHVHDPWEHNKNIGSFITYWADIFYLKFDHLINSPLTLVTMGSRYTLFNSSKPLCPLFQKDGDQINLDILYQNKLNIDTCKINCYFTLILSII